jgi:hypothetical protein
MVISALLDTSVVVDLLRNYPPAQMWFGAQYDLGLSRAVWLEVIAGAQNRRDEQRALKLLKTLPTEEISSEDGRWATDKILLVHLRLNADAFDCLIAATAHRLQVPLYTRNLKHFQPLLGSLAIQPY